MIPTNPLTIARAVLAAARDELRKFMWTLTVATRGAAAAKRWQR